MYAQLRPSREQRSLGGNQLYAFGSLARAMLGLGQGVVEVELEIDDNGTYWGWLPRHSDRPIYIADSPEDVAVAFSDGDRTKRIADAIHFGYGSVVRLGVEALEEVQA